MKRARGFLCAFAGLLPLLREFFGELDGFATAAGADLDAGQQVAVEDFIEIAIGFDDRRLAALEVTFGELGFDKEAAPAHVDFSAIDATTAASHTPEQQEVINLSNMKWDWMADKKVDSLETLFDDKAMFTHMGGTWGKTQELATIKSGGIWYKKAFVYAVDARIFGNTAILLEDIDLQAVVGTHEVTNPFMVTEVYNKEHGKWKLAQLTFSHLLRPVKVNSDKN